MSIVIKDKKGQKILGQNYSPSPTLTGASEWSCVCVFPWVREGLQNIWAEQQQEQQLSTQMSRVGG